MSGRCGILGLGKGRRVELPGQEPGQALGERAVADLDVAVGVGLAAFVLTGVFIFYNTNVLNEYVPSDLAEKRLALQRAQIEQAFLSALDTGQGWDMELPYVTAKGRSIWVRSIWVRSWSRSTCQATASALPNQRLRQSVACGVVSAGSVRTCAAPTTGGSRRRTRTPSRPSAARSGPGRSTSGSPRTTRRRSRRGCARGCGPT